MNFLDKKKIKILILSCDNGLGHVKRSIILANQLVHENYFVELVCSKQKFSKILKVLDISKNIINIDLKINYVKKNQTFSINKKKLEKIPQIKKYDIVISDNLIEVLTLRPDAIILANFWWHDVINYRQKESSFFENLLKTYQPKIIGSKIFATESVKKNINFIPTGLITQNVLNSKKKNFCKTLLISVGSSRVSVDLYKSFFSRNMDILRRQFDDIYCDPILINRLNKNNILKVADYTSEMYKKVDVAIVRPGLGTIIDLLSHQCVSICVYEKNSEMINNAKIIEKSSIGFNFGIVNRKNQSLKHLIKQIKIRKNHIEKNIRTLNMSGLDETLKILKKEIHKL